MRLSTLLARKRYVRCFASLVLVVIFFTAGVSFGQSVDGWRPLIDELETKHPKIEARRLLWRSLKELPEAKMAWEDPVIRVGLINTPTDTFSFDQEAMTQKVIGITQKLPSFAKRTANRRAAEADADIARAKIDLLSANLIAMLKKTVYKIAYFDRALEVLAKNETILEQFIRIAGAKYSAGKGIQLNVIQAQVERSKLIDKKLSISESRRRAVVRLNRLLGREMISEFKVEQSLLKPSDEAAFEACWKKAEKNSPLLALKKAEHERSKRGVEQAEGELGMDVTFSAQYGQREDNPDDRPDFLSATAAATVPLWKSSKQEKLITAARLRSDEAAFNYTDSRQSVMSDLHQATISFTKEKKTIDLYTSGVIPQARQALESSMAAYQSDKVDFLTMLTNELTLLKYELELENVRYRLRRISADIEFLEGSAIDKG